MKLPNLLTNLKFKILTNKLFLFPLSIAIATLVPSVAFAGVKNAMTWTTLNYIKTWDGLKTYALVSSDKTTNAYSGDTSNTNFLPVLCIKKTSLPKPSVIPLQTNSLRGAKLNPRLAIQFDIMR